MQKKFSPKLHAENDARAKKLATKVYKDAGFNVRENPDIYGPDLILEKNQIEYYAECEIKHSWKDLHFGFDSVQIPARKLKYTRMGKPITFCVINEPGNKAFLIGGTDVSSSPIVSIVTKYSEEGAEEFVQVPLDKTTPVFISL